MSLTLLDTLLWAAGSLLNAALLCVLVVRKRYRTFPWFTAWIAFGSLFSLCLLGAHKLNPHRLYAATYWSGAVVDMIFQVAVVLEIGRTVLRRKGTWVEGVLRRLTIMGGVGAVLAIALALAFHPPATTGLALWATRGNVFTVVLVCTLFTGVVAASQQFGLSWRNHAYGVGYGLIAWTLTGLAVDILQGYFGGNRYVKGLDYFEKAVYVGSLSYWLLTLSRNEPPEKKITPEQKKRVTALQNELEFGSPGGRTAAGHAVRK